MYLSTSEKFDVFMDVLQECLDEDVIEEHQLYWMLSFYRHKYGILLDEDVRKKLGI